MEQDFVAPTLHYIRRYNSHALNRIREFTGENWRSNYEKSISLIDDTGLSIGILDNPIAMVHRETGQEIQFELINGVWIADPDVTGNLEQTPTGWIYQVETSLVETYDLDGRLISQTNANGLETTLSYDALARLETVTGPFGRTLSFTYDASNRVETMTDPGGNVYRYGYGAFDNLASVKYPDETPADDSDNPIRLYHYEIPATFRNHLTGITDENGVRFATWAYDAEGRAISAEQAGGVGRVDFVYNPDGTTTVTDTRGAVRAYGLDTQFGVEKAVSVSGDRCTTCGSRASAASYDANGFLASETDFDGNVTTFVHDAWGLETSRTEAAGTPEERTITTQWHPAFRLPVLITQPGKTTAFSYDAQGRLLTRTQTDTATSNTRTVTHTYNAQGLLASRDGPRTDVIDVSTFAYDTQGNLTETTNALGQKRTVTAYDPHGRPLTLEDPNGLITTLAYDARNRLLSHDVGGQLTAFEYDGVGNVTKTTLPDSSFLLTEYDDAQRLIAIEDNLGNRTEFTLDAAGNRVGETVRDPSSTITRTRSRVYDVLSRLTQDIGGAGQTTDFEYDLQGNQTAVVDGNAARTTSEFDALNRLAKSVNPNLGETEFGYDARDNLVSVTDAENLATTFTYDGLENLTTQSSPDTGLTQFTYDDAGNRLSQTDARGVAADFSYDSLNRLVSIEYPDTAKNVGLEYDLGPNGIGRLTRMTDESGSTGFVYDIRGNLVSETRTIDGVAYATTYSFDSADRILSTTYPSGTVITYTRDALGRIDSVSTTTGGSTQTLASNVAYLPFGSIDGFDYGNGIPLSREFDQDYRLTAQTAGSVQDIALGYDPANKITSLVDGLDSARTQDFVYDGLNRLTQGDGIYGVQDYSYDRIGNRLSLTTTAGGDTYLYGTSSHRLDAITGANSTSFSYDANGNTIAKGPLSFTYDDSNRMTEAFASGVQLAAYTYNAKGERVKKTRAGGGGTASESLLFADPFSAPDGTVVDDQADARWRGKSPKDAISATVAAGAVQVAPAQAIRTAATFADIGNTTLVVRARLIQGTLVLKHPGAPRGVRVRFNGKRRVAVTSGVFNDAAQRTKVVFRLPAASRHIDMALHLRADTTRVVITDDQGISHDTGDMSSAALGPDDVYRLKLRAIKVKGVAVPGLFDDIQISRRTDTGLATTTHFVYDQGGKLIGEYDAAGAPIAEYVHLGNRPLALHRDGATYYYHTDHLGTPQALTDQGQQLVWRADYTPFGDTIVSANGVENALRFPGQYFDAETGLHYNYFRDYDPAIGRYTQSDPVGLLGGINTYAYVSANPINYIDPDGRQRGTKLPPAIKQNIPSGQTSKSILDTVAKERLAEELGINETKAEELINQNFRFVDPGPQVPQAVGEPGFDRAIRLLRGESIEIEDIIRRHRLDEQRERELARMRRDRAIRAFCPR